MEAYGTIYIYIYIYIYILSNNNWKVRIRTMIFHEKEPSLYQSSYSIMFRLAI
ncbi:hypothetical protein K6L59_02775 [Candidatus Phytoplasma sp. Tabriz.2]|nr:hypothetical protein [Candidatus Phytoplasma australiense]